MRNEVWLLRCMNAFIHDTYTQIRVCTMYIQNYICINMYVNATYNYVKTCTCIYITNILGHPAHTLFMERYRPSPYSCILHPYPNEISIQSPTWYIQVYTRIYYVHTVHMLQCTWFTTTIHFKSGPISLATPASLSSALAPRLQSNNLPVSSLLH